MTHVIGKPQPPRRGATFGDVPVAAGTDSLFVCVEGRTWWKKNWHQAIDLSDGLHGDFIADARVTPLRTEPVEPGPDPAVTTYGELTPGFFQEPSSDGEVMYESQHGAVRLTDGDVQHLASATPCRPVAASVVVHEEPGTAVLVGHRGHDVYMMGSPWSWSDLERIVREGAAALAQRDAERKEDERANRVVDAAMSRARLTQTTTPLESTEDRSKPAPGYGVGYGIGSWCAWGPDGLRAGFETKPEAVAYTWERHDAEQAGEGGSDE